MNAIVEEYSGSVKDLSVRKTGERVSRFFKFAIAKVYALDQ